MLLINELNKKPSLKKPLWLMRQAGRYLPEYMAIRSNFADFMDFCFSKEIVEISLQPIKRFDFDAAIIFSDILVIPHLLGQKVIFKKNEGIFLDKFDVKLTSNLISQDIEKIYTSINQLRQDISSDKAVIGFVGAPFTVASYMISEGKTKDYNNLFNKIKNIDGFNDFYEHLTDKIANHAINQIMAGANTIQIFESWSAFVPKELQEEFLFKPLAKIVKAIRNSFKDFPIIYYSRGVVKENLEVLKNLNIALSLDENQDLSNFNNCSNIVFQGNLSSEKLLNGNFEQDVLKIKEFAKNRSFVFNLGHGINKDTPIKNVEKMVELFRS